MQTGSSDLSGWRRRCPDFGLEGSQVETERPEQPSPSSDRPEWANWERTSCSRPTASPALPAPDADLQKNTQTGCSCEKRPA